MRRKDREVTDISEILDIIGRCQVCRLAFFDEDFPYIVPMNFGVCTEDGAVILYFHCAKAGKKLDLMQKNNRVCFEMDTGHRLVTGERACDYTMEFESVVGFGDAEMVGEDGKAHALTAVMRQYSDRDAFEFDEKHLAATAAFKVKVASVTGKRLRI